jgi:nifR3 family TIM-barrel protein
VQFTDFRWSRGILQSPLIRPLQVRGLRLATNLAFAPMSGVSNLPARLIAREAGAGLVFSETLSARALLERGARTARKLATAPAEAPLAYQLFGADPTLLAGACRLLADRGAVWIDLNLGCPVKKFVRWGAGAALLREPLRVAEILGAMRAAFPGVLSVKMRLGWDAGSRNAPQLARLASEQGVDLISVHGRTRAQQYRGRTSRDGIRQVVEAVPGVPVFANGDVRSAGDTLAMLRETGAAGVMIGRGAVGNPWIFRDAGAEIGPTRPGERLRILERHVELLAQTTPDPALRSLQVRRYAAAYSKGLPGGARFREAARRAESLDGVLSLARDFLGDARAVA